jgi:uncharacterized membrane protein YfcA
MILGSALVGLLVGMTGAGGGALMTPMLILLFSVKPSTAISSDLVAAVIMRPVGAAVHYRRRTINFRLVAWSAAGSVPAAFAGAYILHELGHTKAAQTNVEYGLGAALLLGTAAMVLRYLLDQRTGQKRTGTVGTIGVRPLLTLVIGLVGGFIVGITSVGAGSLMIVLLMFLYPTLGANQLVGTDLAQAIPLTGAAALGALAFGHISLPLTTSIVVGAVPAVLVGSLLSSRVRDAHLRPAIGIVIFASGLKYAGVDIHILGWLCLAAVMTVLSVAFVNRRAATKPTTRNLPDTTAAYAASTAAPGFNAPANLAQGAG